MDEKERERIRRKRQKERKRKKRRKNFLIFLAAIVLFAAVFVITLKICNPDFDFSTLIPQKQIKQAVNYVNEDILGKTTTQETSASTVKTTTQTTTKKTADYDYAEFSEFAFDTSLQGNQMGNLLNSSEGAVTYSSSYIYYSIDGKGIYKFEPTEEKNSKLLTGDYNFKYLNVLGDYLYAVDADTQSLKKIPVSGGDSVTVCDGISFAYLYNDKIYYIGTDGTSGYIETKDFSKTVLYTANADKELKFAGISLSRIFLVLHDKTANYDEYITVALNNAEDKAYYKNDTEKDEILNLQLEGGFMYFYQKQTDGSFNLCRQKFGSENIVTLEEDCTLTDYPVIYGNRLYYSSLDGSKVKAREINMNSMDKKTMLSVSGCDSTSTVAVGYGYQYVFLIGEKEYEGESVCKCSCIYTSSSGDNTLTFKDGKLKY